MHHNPYFGLGDEEGEGLLDESFHDTKELYIKEFGEAVLTSDSIFKQSSQANTCSSSSCSGRGK